MILWILKGLTKYIKLYFFQKKICVPTLPKIFRPVIRSAFFLFGLTFQPILVNGITGFMDNSLDPDQQLIWIYSVHKVDRSWFSTEDNGLCSTRAFVVIIVRTTTRTTNVSIEKM